MTDRQNMPLPPAVLCVIDRLKSHGYEAYVVGGCVRDFILGRKIHDYDVATSARPDDCKRVFSDMRVITIGEKHGTVTVIADSDNNSDSLASHDVTRDENENNMEKNHIEITTYRIDGEYDDSRHPREVIFTKKLRDDLSRRDFTINALAYNPKCGIVDIFGGIEDAKNKMIRTVGIADKRFEEDALRILRALRFSSVLGFDIENKTAQSIENHRDELTKISAERIREEFSKLLLGKNATEVIRKYKDVISVFIPQIKCEFSFNQRNPHHKFDIFEHTLHALDASPSDLCIRLAVFLHDIGKPDTFSVDANGVGHFIGHEKVSADIAEKICANLKFDNKTKNHAVSLIRYHGITIEETKKAVKRALFKYGDKLFFDLMEVKKADMLGTGYARGEDIEHIDRVISIAKEILSESPCMSLSDLDFNGNDAMKIGFVGKEIGDALSSALTAVVDGDIPNDKNAIKEYLLCRKKK